MVTAENWLAEAGTDGRQEDSSQFYGFEGDTEWIVVGANERQQMSIFWASTWI